MAEGKKSFVFYADWKEIFSELKDSDAGKLIKHTLMYVNDENPPEPTGTVKMAWIPIKQQLKRDLKKWETTIEGRSKAGKASAEKRKQNPTNLTNVEFVQKNSTNSTDTVNVNVNVTDNVNVTVKEVYLRVREKIFYSSVSDYLKKEMQIFLNQWEITHRPPEPDLSAVLMKMDTEYVCYTFNDERHLQNAFKATSEKIKHEKFTTTTRKQSADDKKRSRDEMAGLAREILTGNKPE